MAAYSSDAHGMRDGGGMWLGLSLTAWIIIAVIVGLIGYDVLVFKIGQPTESMVLREWGWRWNSMALCAGILCGHWWGNLKHVDYTAWGFAAPVIVGYITWDALLHWLTPERLYKWYRYPLLHVLIGIPVGMFFWGQVHEGAWF